MNNAENIKDERSSFSRETDNDENDDDLNSNFSELSENSNREAKINNKFLFKKDDKIIVCWNCQSLLILLEDAEFAKCDKCKSINKVQEVNFLRDQEDYVTQNEKNFNIQVPFMFILVNCPFCQTENRARKDSDLVVCFICYNSFSVFKEKTNQNNNSNSNRNSNNNPNQSNNNLNHIIPWIQSDLDNRENYLRNQTLKNNAILNNMANNINNMMGNYVDYSKNYIDQNLNKFTNDILHPIIDKYNPLLQENLELMSKMNANFEKFKRFERMYLSDKLQLPGKKIDQNLPLNQNPTFIKGNNYLNGNDYNHENRNRIKSSNFHGSLGNSDYYLGNIENRNNFINYEKRKFDPVFGEVNNRNFRTAGHLNNNRKGINFDQDTNENSNFNYPRVYSFDENGKLVKNIGSFNNY